MSDQKKKQGRKKVPYLVKIDRLKKLIDKEKSRQVIADSFGCDVSTITKHYNGDNPVDLEMLYNYAKYFNVSTDYLLGLSDIQTSNIDKKEICRRLHIPDEMYDILRELFLHISPGAYLEILEDDYNYFDRNDPRYNLKMQFRKEEAVEFLSRTDTVTLQYIVIKELLTEAFVLNNLAPTVCYKSIALSKAMECSEYETIYESKRKEAFEAGDIAYDEFMTNTGGYFVTEEGKALSDKWTKAIDEQEEAENLADAKEWQLQKQLSKFIDRITDKITKDYYFLDEKMYDRKTNEIVDEYPI